MGTQRLSQNDGMKPAAAYDIASAERRQYMPFKEYCQDQMFLFPPSVHDFLPKDHMARGINGVSDELDLREPYDRYSDFGCTAYRPQLMWKVLFYGYAMGERNSRVIAHRLRSDVADMYLSALQQPDFRTINLFRKDHIDLLRGLFVQIVRFCVEMGMVSVGTIAIDGMKLKANARIAVALIFILILLPATGHAKGYEAKKKAGDYEIEIRIDRNPIVLGDNHIEIEIKSRGKTVKDAKVLVNYYMPPMPRMPPMNFKTYAELKGDRYNAKMDIIMAGPWIIVIKIYRGEKPVTTKVHVDAQ
jgi:transposase